MTVMDATIGWIPIVGNVTERGKDRVNDLKAKLDEVRKDGPAAGTETADGIRKIDEAATEAVRPLEEMFGLLSEWTSANIDQREAQRELEEAIDAAQAAYERNGVGLDENTEKGRQNAGALDRIATNAMAAAQAILDTTGSQDLANAALERGRQKFIELADKMGLSKTQAQALATQLFGIPSPTPTVTLRGEQAINEARRVGQALAGIKNKTVWVSARFSGIENVEEQMNVRLGRRALGGPIDGPGPKGVDSELILAAPGEHVWTAREVDAAGGHDAMYALRRSVLAGEARGGPAPVPQYTAMPAAGGGTQRVEVVLRLDPRGVSARDFAGLMAKALRDAGGNPLVLGV